MNAEPLPVAQCFGDIARGVADHVAVVLKAPPGAGKTTGVPIELIDRGVTGGGKILLIQPRRLAARSAAARIAQRMNVRLGERVGYHVRFDRKTCTDTQLIAMTTGMLLRRLQDDPLLEDVSCVMLDEFHERSWQMDLSLGMLHRIRATLRPELKLLVMSATLDPQPIVDFLGNAIAVTSLGRSFPVDVHYTKTVSRDSIGDQVVHTLPEVLRRTDGHVLVFLPGIGEIRSTRRTIEAGGFNRGGEICELYGDLSPQAQDQVLAESQTRKIILATNVAETSITIAGVTGVIDSGLARVMRFDSGVGLPKLQLEPISQASADQRAGRAGRTRPGVCYRLWPAVTHRSRKHFDAPEIQRADFCEAMLMLMSWGEREVFDFPWLTPPTAEAVTAAQLLLQRLGAIHAEQLTSIGKAMTRLPLHPRLARLVIEGSALGIVTESAFAAALLSERDPFRGEATGMHSASGCDMTTRVDRLMRFRRGESSAVPNVAAAKSVCRIAEQIIRSTDKTPSPEQQTAPEPSVSDRLTRCLLAAYPDRVARRRHTGDHKGLMVGGRGVVLDRSSACRSGELFLCLDVDAGGSEAKVRAASEIQVDWLDSDCVRVVDEPFFHPSTKAVVARRRTYYHDLMLSESPIECEPSSEVAVILADQAMKHLPSVFPSGDKSVAGWIDRVGFLTTSIPDCPISPLDDSAIRDVVQELCQTRTSFASLRGAPWLDSLRWRYEYADLQWIDQNAPLRMTVPSGNSIAIAYAPGKPPVMQVRIQELFGWTETPRIAGGRVPIQLHLLGPNHRPQQITEDLANFWNETYHHVRKELKRRYPKHHWPDDPTQATATARGLKPK